MNEPIFSSPFFYPRFKARSAAGGALRRASSIGSMHGRRGPATTNCRLDEVRHGGIILGLFKVIFYFPNGKSTIWEIYSEYF